MRLTVTEGLRFLALKVNKSIAQISRAMGYKTPASLINMITRGSIRMDVGAKMAEECGYRMILLPNDYEMPDDAIEIKGEAE